MLGAVTLRHLQGERPLQFRRKHNSCSAIPVYPCKHTPHTHTRLPLTSLTQSSHPIFPEHMQTRTQHASAHVLTPNPPVTQEALHRKPMPSPHTPLLLAYLHELACPCVRGTQP